LERVDPVAVEAGEGHRVAATGRPMDPISRVLPACAWPC
jgi:hypothetical protein